MQPKRFTLLQKQFFLLMLTFLVSLNSCYRDKEELLYPGSTTAVDCSSVPTTFNAEVKSIFTSKCAINGCHDATASGGLIFQSYQQIHNNLERINIRALVQKTMPPTGALPPAEINKIKCWIDAGALEN